MSDVFKRVETIPLPVMQVEEPAILLGQHITEGTFTDGTVVSFTNIGTGIEIHFRDQGRVFLQYADMAKALVDIGLFEGKDE